MLSVPVFWTLWSVMHSCCTFIHLRATHFPWYASEYPLSLRHVGKIHLSSFTFSLFSTFLLLQRPLFWRSQTTDGTLGSDHIPPTHFINDGKSDPAPPCDGCAQRPIPLLQQSHFGRWDVPVKAGGTDNCRLTVIPKPRPSPASCVIRRLKSTVLES